MKKIILLFIGICAAPLFGAPVTNVSVARPATSSASARPVTAGGAHRPTTEVSVVRPVTAAGVSRPSGSVIVSRPQTSVSVTHPTTSLSATRLGERGLSSVSASASASGGTFGARSASSGGSYTPSYKKAKSFSSSKQNKSSDGGLGMTDPNAAQKEADAKSAKVKKAMSTQVSVDDVLKNTEIPENLRKALGIDKKADNKKK